MIQQGDVLIKKVSKLPEGLKKLNHLTLAEGEVTNHYHRVTEGKAELYEANGVMYLHVDSDTATITHEEHHPAVVEKGDYEIGRVQEYDHFSEEAKAVRD